ncbi:cytochrome P450 [Biscogniauxia marginata]|nr:cytochrome P450 [Biscogniauxia marginata]
MAVIGNSVLMSFLAQYWLHIALLVVVARLVRNRYHNGLNKYPGPFLASLTDLWRLWDVYCQRPELTHQRLHAKYGDVVRLGPNTLSFADPKALKAIYGLNKGFVKSDFYIVQQSTVKGHNLASLFSTTDNTFHAQFRRCVNAAFAMSALVQYEPFVDNTTRLFLRQTERLYAGDRHRAGAVCDLTRWLQFYAFDVIGEITYGRRHGFLEKNEDIDGIVGYLSNLFLYVAPIGQIPWLDLIFLKNPIYLKLSQWGFIDATMPVARFARARMAERLGSSSEEKKKPLLPVTNDDASPESEPSEEEDDEEASPRPDLEKPPASASGTGSVDLLSKFLAARDARPDFMTDTLVQTMAVSMAFAGSETTAISLSAVLYYLLRHPRSLARLRAELDGAARRGAFADNETGLVTWAESQRLPYLDACVKEAFRLHPAAGLPLERVVPAAGAEVAGSFVPGGTIVGCSAWIIHRRPEIWGEDVEAFRPERWLVDEDDDGEGEGDDVEESSSSGRQTRRAEKERHVREMNGYMFQFGMGSRTCIGKNISLLEIYKVVPSLLRRFEIRFKDPSQEWKLVNAWFVKQQNFEALFELRDLVQPIKEEGNVQQEHTTESEKVDVVVS